jgi:tRNA pseudouridine65 synthase
MTFNTTPLDILYEDQSIIAINKPHGLLVHRSRMANDAKEFAVQIVRNHVGDHVYPVHRLDRKTSGVLVFAKSAAANSHYQQLFRERQVEKEYWAIVRGFIADSGTIDYPLNDGKKIQDAVTHYEKLEHFEINLAAGGFPTSRYSLVKLLPETGRMHQLRKHMAHIFHPIIGDRPHGCNKQNRLWKQRYDMITMMLHARRISFPFSAPIEAGPSEMFNRVVSILQSGKAY